MLSGVEYFKSLGGTVGSNCRIYTTTFGSEPCLISIGNHVTITSGVKILTHDGATWLTRDQKGRRYSFKKTIIGNHVFIGVNSIIMPGVIIEDRVIVAAGSLVTKSIPSGSIVGGNPARIIGSYDSYEKRALEQFVSDEDLDKQLPYRERIEQILDAEPKAFMKKPE